MVLFASRLLLLRLLPATSRSSAASACLHWLQASKRLQGSKRSPRFQTLQSLASCRKSHVYRNTTVISISLTRRTSFTSLTMILLLSKWLRCSPITPGHLFWVADGSGCQPVPVQDGLTGSSLSNANAVQVELHWKRTISSILAVVWPEAAAIKQWSVILSGKVSALIWSFWEVNAPTSATLKRFSLTYYSPDERCNSLPVNLARLPKRRP